MLEESLAVKATKDPKAQTRKTSITLMTSLPVREINLKEKLTIMIKSKLSLVLI